MPSSVSYEAMYDSREGGMETRDFDKFVASQQDADTETDWEGVRDEWLRDLDSLYVKVREFLREYVADGSISYSFAAIQLAEENIGTYSAMKMDIKIGKQRVSLVPVGTLLIGSKGRVDAVGSAGRALILLVNQKARSAADLIKVTVNIRGSAPPSPPRQRQPISWAWKIATNAPHRKFVDLEKEAFLTLLMEIANA
jgi:hypothetical protein